MEYDKLKDTISTLLQVFPSIRLALFRVMDLMLLRQRYVKRAIRKHLPRNRQVRLYDAGAGYGQYSWYVLKEWPKARVFALELKIDYLRQFAAWMGGQEGSRFSFAAGDLQIYQPKNRYDLVIAIDILEHIPDDLAVLNIFYQSLKPGGKLIISTPSDKDEAAKFTEEHVRPGYNMQDLVSKLNSCGFDILSKHYSYGVFGSLAWRFSIRKPLELLDKSKLYALLLPLYYLPALPIAMLFNWLDMKVKNPSGTGIILVAER